jgi:hypothetical protein
VHTSSAIDRYLACAQSNDIDALVETLADDPELVSPLSGRMVFRGREDLRVLLRVVYGSLRGTTWQAPVRDGKRCVVLGESRVGRRRSRKRQSVTANQIGDGGRHLLRARVSRLSAGVHYCRQQQIPAARGRSRSVADR